MATPLRGALIGCGFFANNHLHAWRDLAPRVAMVAVCDRDRSKAEAARMAGEEARVAADAAREAVVDAVRATAEAMNASLEQMKVVEEMRRTLRELRDMNKLDPN